MIFLPNFWNDLPMGKAKKRGFKTTKGKTQELFFNYILTEFSCFLPFATS